MRPGRRPRERGTAALEFVVLVPIVVLVALFVMQVGVAAWTASQTQEAARQSARAHSLGEDPLAAAEQALPGSLHVDDIDEHDLDVAVGLLVVTGRIDEAGGLLIALDTEHSRAIG